METLLKNWKIQPCSGNQNQRWYGVPSQAGWRFSEPITATYQNLLDTETWQKLWRCLRERMSVGYDYFPTHGNNNKNKGHKNINIKKKCKHSRNGTYISLKIPLFWAVLAHLYSLLIWRLYLRSVKLADRAPLEQILWTRLIWVTKL